MVLIIRACRRHWTIPSSRLIRHLKMCHRLMRCKAR
nr:MAG TPA: hypothetical protein [Caudoviricetes sp.]